MSWGASYLTLQSHALLLAFCFEIMAMMFVFGPRKIVGHAGYALDVAVLAFIIFFVVGGHAEAARSGRITSTISPSVPVRLLGGAFRFAWRASRIVSSFVQDVRSEHEEALKQLKHERKRNAALLRRRKKVAEEVRALVLSRRFNIAVLLPSLTVNERTPTHTLRNPQLRRAQENAKRSAEMLRSYKDEVAFLREALQIAAEKVAEVEAGGGDYSGFMDDDDEEDVDEGGALEGTGGEGKGSRATTSASRKRVVVIPE